MGCVVLFIDPKYFKTNTVHRNILGTNVNQNDGILSCGFLVKNKDYNQTAFLLDYYVGLYVLNGTGTYVDENGKKYKLYPGCFMQRFPEQLHSHFIDYDSNWLEFYICIGKTVFESMSQLNIFNPENPVFFIGESQKLINDIIAYMERLRIAEIDELPDLLFETQRIIYHTHQKGKHMNDSHTPLISLACKKIRENLSVGTSIKDIAQSLGMGYESFRKKFTKTIGLSPGEFMIIERINAAKIKLLDDNMSIKEVALSFDYADISAFVTQFKKYTGITPGKFIKR